jgi:hypothetical protein
MPATSPSSEHFGWAQHYEQPEEYWAEQDRRHEAARAAYKRELEARAEMAVRTAVGALLGDLTRRGLLREDRLSYTRICQLEHETGIFTGSWSDYLNALREAQQKDEETWKS